jgi:hypothetical protein
MIPSMIWLFGDYSVNIDTSDFFPHHVVTWPILSMKKGPLYLLQHLLFSLYLVKNNCRTL